MQSQEVRPIRLWQPLMLVVFALVVVWYGINVLNTGNPMFFIPIQPEYRPARILVRNYGETLTVQPGHPDYEPLVEALNVALGDFSNNDAGTLGLSDETLRRYREDELVLEIYYGEQVVFNTNIRMTGVNQLLIPIDGTHAAQGNVFMGTNGSWRVGTLRMSDSSGLRATLRALGYLQDG